MSCCIQFLKWNALSLYFYLKNSFSKNIHYAIHLIFKNGINNIFPFQTSFLLLSCVCTLVLPISQSSFVVESLIHDGIFLPSEFMLCRQNFHIQWHFFAVGLFSKFRGLNIQSKSKVFEKNLLYERVLLEEPIILIRLFVAEIYEV